MKYTDKKISGQNVEVYRFWMSAEEMLVLSQTLSDTLKKTSKNIETASFHSRMRSIIKELNNTIKKENIKFPKKIKGLSIQKQ